MDRQEKPAGLNVGVLEKRWRLPGRKYRVIYRSVLMENLQYAANIALGFFGYFVFIFIFIKLWDYMYRSPGELIAGYSKEQMIWYVMMTEMMWFGSNASAVGRQVKTDIRGGNIAYLMNKPYHYTLYILAKYTGEWSIRLPMYAGLAVVIGTVMVGPVPGFRLITVPAMALCIVLGLTINAVFKICPPNAKAVSENGFLRFFLLCLNEDLCG